MRCTLCSTELRFRNRRHSTAHTEMQRSYYCPSCGATVDTLETIVMVKPPPDDARVPPRSVPKRKQHPTFDVPSAPAPLDEPLFRRD